MRNKSIHDVGLAVEEHTDQELLRRFIAGGDDEAFRAIVVRHARIVFCVCRDMLSNEQDVEDACQATLLVLAKNARKIRRSASLASWLYGTAYRICLRASSRNRRRREVPLSEASANLRTSLVEVADQHANALLHEELEQMPDKFRAPLIICYLKGKSRQEAAGELGCSVGAVKGRLERGRQHLRLRLLARGGAMTVLLASATGSVTASAPLCSCFLPAMTDAVCAYSAGQTMGIATQVLQLAQGDLGLMAATTTAKSVAASLLLGSVLSVLLMLMTARGVSGQLVQEPSTIDVPMASLNNEAAPIQLAAQGGSGGSGKQNQPKRTGPRVLKLDGPVTSVKWSADGRRMAVVKRRLERVNRDGKNRNIVYRTVRVHDATSGKEIMSLGELAKDGMQDYQFSPDGKKLAVSKRHTIEGGDHVEVYDTSRGDLLRTIEFEYGRSRMQMAFSPDGTTLAVVYGGPRTKLIGGARLFDVSSGEQKRQLLGHKYLTVSVAYSPDGKLLATGGDHYDKEVRLWKTKNGKLVRRLKGLEGASVTLAFSPDGKTLAAADNGSGVQMWDVESGKRQTLQDNPDSARSVVFSRDGRLVASGRHTKRNDPSTGEIRLWDRATGKLLLTIPKSSASVSIRPDNKSLAYLSPTDGTVRIIDLSPHLIAR